jgi:hypothetical protein
MARPGADRCVASWLPYDLTDVDAAQLADWLQPLAAKLDKLVLVVDASHAAGEREPASGWQGKSAVSADALCRAEASHDDSHDNALTAALTARGWNPQDVVGFSATHAGELALQSAAGGGLATGALSACLFGGAHDTDGSGAISAQELVDCTQPKIELALRDAALSLPVPHIALAGNRDFVPAWFAQPVAVEATAAAASGVPAASGSQAVAPMARVLEQIHEQRDGSRTVQVGIAPQRLAIGNGTLALRISSSHAGHVYIAMLGSDGESLYLLFPNDKDDSNLIGAGETLTLPRPSWQVSAGGPPGLDRLLVIVSDGPRDLAALGGSKAGPFVKALTDAQGRTQLQRLLGHRTPPRSTSIEACAEGACSDAFGSALVSVQEY